MKTLHLYLTRQVLLTLMLTVSVFTFVLLLTNLLKEILTLLVNHQATLWLVLEAIGLLIPFVLAFALPMGMLTAALLVFGRFSADQELTAARASGLSLMSLITPVLLLSVALSVLCGLVNLEIAPKCRVAYKEMLFRLGFESSTGFVQEERFVDFPGWVVYVRKRDGNHLQDVRLYQVDNDRIRKSITATDGVLEQDLGAHKLFVTLTNATVVERFSRSPVRPPQPELSTNAVATGGTNAAPIGVANSAPAGMTNASPAPAREVALTNGASVPAQVQAQASAATNATPPRAPEQNETRQGEWIAYFAPEYGDEISIAKAAEETHQPKLSEMTYHQLRREIRDRERQGIDTTPAQVQLHRQVAFSFASIGFTLIGIPLAIRAHRRETTAGIAMALVLVLVYYSFVILAQSWQMRAEFAPQLVVWLPNFLFQSIGAVLLARANRGF